MVRRTLLRWIALGALGIALAGGSFAVGQSVAPTVQQIANPGTPGGNGG